MFQGSVTKSAVSSAALRETGLRAHPAQVAEALRQRGGLVWLDSAGAGCGAWSVVAAEPVEILRGNIWENWDLVTQKLQEHGRDWTGESAPTGGLFGWVGYDGDFVLGHYPRLLALDHDCDIWHDQDWLAVSLPDVLPTPAGKVGELRFRPRMEREQFIAAVEKAQAYITAGDIYQVNLACEWTADFPSDQDALALYRRLRTISPAPYASFLELDGTRVLSSSPECFLRMEGRNILTRPIKGTRPRFVDDDKRDEASAHELSCSPKERAELLMITDLERNDLGMVCEYGSVRVPELAVVEKYAQVFHLVSTVTGQLRKDVSHAEAFKACFPGGSITGAPKRRAREIISELERTPRGIYTGAIGYFGFNGRSEFNIAIRTAVQTGSRMSFHVGSGIVADSIPSLEWEETLHKAGGLLRMAGQQV